ncbi:MAG: BrnT family toxin [Thiomonas sp.]|uniref:BrnT family toxin n=1 Tax=Thiomonas sp. TaxID=2047785 RepID=UPI002A368AD7|nr:BrnT family toxin [Thiomonas sp.]MDY0331452.1 BrnT family toxin [Thiomonas sp.]
MSLTWDETKRQANLQKHGLDFALAHEVLESRFRLDLGIERRQEQRVLSMSYVLDMLAVLVVVHTQRGDSQRIISFRRASREEREVYHEWLENECDEP